MSAQPARYHVILNPHSGTVQAMGVEKLEEQIRSRLGERLAGIVHCEKDNFKGAFYELAETTDPDETAILLAGGDGTLNAFVEDFLKVGRPVGLLPCGTMNLFAKDLGYPSRLGDILDGYAEGAAYRTVDIGRLNGAPFLCNAVIGVVPKASRVRERYRKENLLLFKKLGEITFAEMEAHKARAYRFDFKDGRHLHHSANCLIVSCNRFTDQPEHMDERMLREDLSGDMLAIYSIRSKHKWDTLRFLYRLFFGNWIKDSSVELFSGHDVVIKADGPESVDASLDGEVFSFTQPMHFQIQHNALTFLVPATAAAAAGAEAAS